MLDVTVIALLAYFLIRDSRHEDSQDAAILVTMRMADANAGYIRNFYVSAAPFFTALEDPEFRRLMAEWNSRSLMGPGVYQREGNEQERYIIGGGGGE